MHVDRGESCWTLTLDRPDKANALSAELVEALIAAVDEAAAAGAQVIAFRGEGRNLSAGFDFGGYEELSDGDLLQRFVRIETLLQAIARSPCLTVGFAHGRNFGAGVDLLAACRWRVAAPGTTFRMPGLGFGNVLGTRRFAAIVGRERARALLEGLATFTAETALADGFVTRIAAQESWPQVLAEAQQAAQVLRPEHRARLYAVLDDGSAVADMADLVRSASVPGLRERIHMFRKSGM
jgi:enoyl-CoA hydratase/carnithine racemase